MNKQLLSPAGLLLAIILFVSFIIVVNNNLTSARIDLTEDRLYTLSSGSLNIIQSVQQPITLRFYYSESVAQALPAIRSHAQRVQELLREYERASNGMIRLLVIDPRPFTDHEQRAEQYGLLGVPIDGEDDPLFFGLAATNELDGLEIIRFFQTANEDKLEYDLTRLVQTLSEAQRRNIAVLSALPIDGEDFDPLSGRLEEGGSPPWPIMGELRALFNVSVLPADVRRIPSSLDALVVVHPKELADATLYAIEQYVLSGGRLVTFVDPHAEIDQPPRDPDNPMSAMMASRASNMDKLFQAWGFQRSPTDVVADRVTATRVDFGARTNHQPIDYVLWQALTPDNMNQEERITANLRRINMATPGHFVLLEDASTEITPLLSSSNEAMLVDRRVVQFRNDPVALLTRYEAGTLSYPMAIRVRGEVQTAFPQGARDVTTGQVQKMPNHRDSSDGPIDVIAIADVDMLNPRFWVQQQDFFGETINFSTSNNVDFLTNAIEDITGTEGLISVRSRTGFSRPFTRVQAIQREAERRFRTQERELQRTVQETQQAIARMQSAGGGEQLLTPEQEQEIAELRQMANQSEQELRRVRVNLRQDIDRLDTQLKFFNIGLVPMIVILLAILSGWLRLRKRRQGRFQH